jgi:hypothetical protein
MDDAMNLDECEAIANIAYLPQDMTLALIAYARRLEQDAARYRFIRATTKAVRDDNGGGRVEVTPEEIDAMTDAAIDAARGESNAG